MHAGASKNGFVITDVDELCGHIWNTALVKMQVIETINGTAFFEQVF